MAACIKERLPKFKRQLDGRRPLISHLEGMPPEIEAFRLTHSFLFSGLPPPRICMQGGMKPYLEYVRDNPRYKTSYIESTLEWRDDVVDGLEVLQFCCSVSTKISGCEVRHGHQNEVLLSVACVSTR
eukprot:1161516-Pelagomonas_calceolata.AAC.7